MAEKTSQTEKATSPLIGNAIAYFLVPVLVTKGLVENEATPEAIAMGGAVVTYILLQLRAFIRWAADLIEDIAS